MMKKQQKEQSADVVSQLKRVQIPAIIVGVLGLGVWALGAGSGTREQFFQTYLLAFLFWIAMPLGGLAILMLQYLTEGKWGFLIRRMLEAAAMTLPLMALLFIPIATMGMLDLYPWADPSAVAHDTHLQFKYAYLNPGSFVFRAGFYFLIWLVWTFFLVKWGMDQDRSGKPALTRRFRNLSGIGIVLYVITMTFAAFDWGMSLEPLWFSAIYGVIFIIGQGLAMFAFVILMARLLTDRKPFSDFASTKLYHDLGNLLFAFVILWTYMSLSQFLIIWSGNLPPETPWYIRRQTSGWNEIAVVVLAFQFVLPFFLLLNRFVKQKIQFLWRVALLIFLMRFVDLFWIVMPAFDQTVMDVHWTTYVAPIGIGGVWLFVFLEILKRRPILPLRDPVVPHPAAEGAAEGLQHMQEVPGHG
jgi:hypothetical protein